ncbi:hypothetical protein [Ramlibacter sp.]|uniref:hypothetical protein n=1 Tax=Ramlibacter sp. TaxID=1917967 RepID=UPI002CF395BE|nr:hypothetical protein [Ramlibacter sp.]HWI82496.1 hypothetical protein [Ramlibacter sp.]
MDRRAAPLLLAALAGAALADEARVDVTLNHSGSDALGKRLAIALAGEIGGSRRLQLVKTSEQRVGIYLATMARDGATVYAATWTLGGMADDGYLTSKVGACEAQALRACARSLFAETDKHAAVLARVRAEQAHAR